MEASLKKFRQVVVLRGAYQTRYVAARQRTRSGVQVVQQNSESLWIEFDDVKLKIFYVYFWRVETTIIENYGSKIFYL